MCDLEVFKRGIPQSHKALIICEKASTFEEFASGVYQLIDMAAKRVEQQAHLRFESRHAEDGWTSKLIDRIDGHGVNARPATLSGNTDMAIDHVDGLFTIICESKIIGNIPGSSTTYDNSHLFQGVLQLVSRYATASLGEDHCVLIVLCFKPKLRKVLDDWQKAFFDYASREDYVHLFEELEEFDFEKYEGVRGFFTSHVHESSGEPVKIRHVPVLLYHNPMDTSGRSRKSA